MEILLFIFFYMGWLFMPIWCIIFCLNLVSILKKVKHEEKTTANTVWLIISFTIIMWSIAWLAVGSSY